ncbi:MAG: DegQ family serine endoprotease [Nitrospinae bacterium]|nr:DegQ family serine endoprotease [Nitrospinota bacterium]
MSQFKIYARWFSLGLILILIGAVAGAQLSKSGSSSDSISSALAPKVVAQGKDMPTTVFTDIAKNRTPAVVNISTKQKVKSRMAPEMEDERMQEFYDRFFPWYKDMPKEQVRQSLGSGFVVEEDGYILTNSHVVDQADEIIVTFGDGHNGSDTEYSAKVIGSDPKTDIAVIKVDAGKKLPTIPLGDSNTLQVGEWVMAIGNPFGFSQSVTVGIVSAKGRAIGAGPYDDFIQTDASINPGNSGGPLLNMAGEVVGINSAIFTGGFSQGNIGIGFAIPIDSVKAIYGELKVGKVSRGWLGVMIQKITPDFMKALKLKSAQGALVGDVFEKSPAESAGLKRGDVIVEFNGQPVPSSDALPKLVGALKPGVKAKVKIIRDGSEKTITLALGEMPEETEQEKPVAPAKDDLGITVEKLTPELAKRFNAESSRGVLVRNVAPQGPAAEAGVRPGDIITEVNRQPVDDLSSYKNALAKSGPAEPVLMLVKRGKSTIFIVVKPLEN